VSWPTARKVLIPAIGLAVLSLLAPANPVLAETVTVGKSPVRFPTEAAPFLRWSDMKQTFLFRPADGAGPFPAVVLLPSCGGMDPNTFDWAERLTKEGYVALLVESNTARGVSSNCTNQPPIKLDQQMVDAAAALEHLRRLEIVESDRLAVLGLSFGGMVGLRMASATYQKDMAFGPRGLRAVASFYPWCDRNGRGFDSRDIVTDGIPGDIVTPTMVFAGGKDDESLPQPCIENVGRVQSRGRPISLKLYPNATHGFDMRHFGLQGRRTPHGYFYRYDPDATEDSWREVKAFFARELRAR
jgi:dienelactone hydrolase